MQALRNLCDKLLMSSKLHMFSQVNREKASIYQVGTTLLGDDDIDNLQGSILGCSLKLAFAQILPPVSIAFSCSVCSNFAGLSVEFLLPNIFCALSLNVLHT